MKYLVLFPLFLLGCSAQTSLQSLEWKSRSNNPAPPITDLLKKEAQAPLNSQSEKVAFGQQKINGIPVESTYIKIIRTKTGDDLQIRSKFEPTLLSFGEKSLQAESFLKQQAETQATILTKYPYFKKQKDLNFKPLAAVHPKGYEFLWVLTYIDKAGLPWEVQFGEKLEIKSLKRLGSSFHDTLAILYPAGPQKSNLSTVKLNKLNVRPTLSNEVLHVSSQADNRIAGLEEMFTYSPDDTRFDQVQVFYYLQESLAWLEKNANFRLPFQLQAEVHIGYPEKTNAAFYYDGKIRLGAGDDVVYKNIPHDPSIVIHESIHSFIDAISGLPFDGEGGALNEGFADFFTALQLGTPNMGEASYLKGPFRRSVENNLKLQQKNGGTYHDSGIISGLLWELSKKWNATKASQLAVYTLNRLTPGSDFADFHNCLLEALTEHFPGKQDQTVVRAILENRGF